MADTRVRAARKVAAMILKDAVIICAKVLKMEPDAIAMAYAIPVGEVEAIIKAACRKKTGGFAVATAVATNGVNGVHVAEKVGP
jgi:hypothetical protein